MFRDLSLKLKYLSFSQATRCNQEFKMEQHGEDGALKWVVWEGAWEAGMLARHLLHSQKRDDKA